VHNAPYIYHGPLQFRVSEERDLRTQRVIAYVDGVLDGAWEGDILVVRTTHIKQEWIRRNGTPNCAGSIRRW
jgi:hypothetical protein